MSSLVGKAARPYIKYEHHQIIVEDNRKNKMDKIHMAFTDGHPRDVTTNSIYYACLDENSLTKGARNDFTLVLYRVIMMESTKSKQLL